MIARVTGKLTKYQKDKLIKEAQASLASWGETGNVELVWDGYNHEAQLNNEDESILVLYKCEECGRLVAELEEVGEYGYCRCGESYLDLGL